VKRCLSDSAQVRVQAYLAGDAERAHLAACSACAARQLHLTAQMGAVARTLSLTPERGLRRAPSTRRWLMIGAASAVTVVALVTIEVAAWRTVQNLSDRTQIDQLAALADVSATLFSLKGEPAGAPAGDATAPLRQIEAALCEDEGCTVLDLDNLIDLDYANDTVADDSNIGGQRGEQ